MLFAIFLIVFVLKPAIQGTKHFPAPSILCLNITIIDYNYAKVCIWFPEPPNMILIIYLIKYLLLVHNIFFLCAVQFDRVFRTLHWQNVKSDVDTFAIHEWGFYYAPRCPFRKNYHEETDKMNVHVIYAKGSVAENCFYVSIISHSQRRMHAYLYISQVPLISYLPVFTQFILWFSRQPDRLMTALYSIEVTPPKYVLNTPAARGSVFFLLCIWCEFLKQTWR